MKTNKKELTVFALCAYAIPFLMMPLLYICLQNGRDTSIFANAQMFYPAAGVMLAFLLAKKTDLRFRGAPWYVYLVGVLGIAIVASSSWCTLRVGASVMLAISTAGQIISSQLIDQFGLFGMPVQKFRAKQLPGYVLLAAGVALVVLGT